MTMRASFLLIAALAGCTSLPETAPPRAVPATWSQSALPAAAVDDQWWRGYGDPVLERIVAEAGSADTVEIARSRLAEARAGLRRARAELAPRITAGGEAARSKPGDDPAPSDTYGGALTFGWSPDISGAERSRASAANARALSFEARLAATRMEVRHTAVRLYIAIRQAQQQRAAAIRTAASLDETAQIATSRHRAGLVPELDAVQARAAFTQARTRPEELGLVETEARLALEVLLGRPPGSLSGVLSGEGAIPPASVAMRALAPAEVLVRRPDLREAEQALAAAGFDARAARADFWPRLSLSAMVGGQDVSPATPFLGPGAVYALGANAAGTVLSFGRLEGARDGADARLQAAAFVYREAAARALSDVERALAAGSAAEARRADLDTALALTRDQTVLAGARYRAGLSPLLEVLVAQRAAFDAEAALAAARADAALAYADLSVAMGLGGEG
jgi:multidrug efflux system outer membrane protein